MVNSTVYKAHFFIIFIPIYDNLCYW